MTALVPMIKGGLLLQGMAVSQVVIVVPPLSRPDVRPRLHAVETRVLDARQPDRRHQVVMRANGERPVLVIGVFGHFDAVVLQLLHHRLSFRIPWWQLQQRRGRLRPRLPPAAKIRPSAAATSRFIAPPGTTRAPHSY